VHGNISRGLVLYHLSISINNEVVDIDTGLWLNRMSLEISIRVFIYQNDSMYVYLQLKFDKQVVDTKH